jgi:SAM-dependent methyltransferase
VVTAGPEVVTPINDPATIRRFYDGEAAGYVATRYDDDGADGLVWRLRQDLIAELVGDAPGRVLDIGSGPGVLAPWCRAASDYLVCADLSFNMVRTGRTSIPGAGGIGWLNCDLSRLPVAPGCIDTMVVVGVFGLVRTPGPALDAFAHALRPGGRLLIQVPNARSLRRSVEAGARRIGTAGRLQYEQRIEQSGIRQLPFRVASFERSLRAHSLQPRRRRFYDFRVPFAGAVSRRLDTATAFGLHQLLARSPHLGALGEGVVIEAVRVP